MISARPRILIKVTFLKHFALEVWVSIACSVIFDCHIFRSYGPAHKILILIAYVHSDVSSLTRGLIIGSDLHLLPYSMYVRSKGSGQTVHMCTLTRAFKSLLGDLMSTKTT